MADPGRVGDLALTRSSTPPARARHDTSWSPLRAADGWHLWATAPTAAWRGHALTVATDGATERFTLGTRPDHWLELRHDPAARTWTVVTDRFATVHAYAADGLVTTFSPAAWAPGAGLDWLAVAGFARFGWYPGDRLPVVGVRLLRPGTEQSWGPDGRSGPARRWVGWDHRPRPRPEAEMVDELAAVLDDVLDDEAAGGRLAVPVSGGLDSRCTVASLTRAGAPDHDLWAYSYGYEPDSPELRIAGEVGAARGLPVTTRVITPYLAEALDPVLAATEGLVDLTLCRQSAMASELAATDAVVAAHWGDVWFGTPAPPPDGDVAGALVTATTKRGHEWLLDHLVRPHLGRDPGPELADLLRAEAEAVGEVADPRMRLLALKTEQWSWRWTQTTLRAFQAATPPRLPFYDPRLADLVLSLPADATADRRLQVGYLRRHAPDLAAVEWQAVETDLFRLRHERTWRLPRRALRRVARTLRPPTARLRNWEVQLLDPSGRALVDRLLVEPGARLHDLVEAAAARDLVTRHRAAPTDPCLGYAVSALLTFAAWWERWG